jgi:hypothetical protein
MKVRVEAAGLGTISVDPATLRLIERKPGGFVLYEKPDEATLLLTAESVDLVESVRALAPA